MLKHKRFYMMISVTGKYLILDIVICNTHRY